MYGDVTTEVVFCPNCKENIPKTLYCLNCGYPLYKIEQEKEESMEQIQDEVEISQDVIQVQSEEDSVSFEFEEMEIEKVNLETDEFVEKIDEDIESIEESKEVLEEFEAEPIEEIETIMEEVEPETIMEEVEPETIDEYVEHEELVEDFEEKVESVSEEEEEVYVEEILPEPLVHDEVPEEQVEIQIEEIMEDEIEPISDEIPIAEEVTLNQVKEETFVKLFDSYVEQGRIWSSRREEILTRLKTDTSLMEEKLGSVKKDFELLEIRKSIGDAAETEYSVKAPAYKWDIEHFEKEINNSKEGIHYVEGIREMVPEDEMLELENYYNQDYSSLINIQGIQEITLQKIKDVLAETLNLFET
jgi:hypothetical protein